MSGIAEVFANQGYSVSGSDLNQSFATQHLSEAGVEIYYGHRAENVGNADVVVISSAVPETNPEVVFARQSRIPVIPRAEMLGELMRGKTGIAVAGSHGKTTTTSMLATILSVAEQDPTFVVGGIVNSFGGNARLGKGSIVVAEADESDGSFLQLPATLGVITNIDNDHLDYYGSLAKLDEAFQNFVGNLPFYGVAAVCGDDPGVRRCLERFRKPIITYGFGAEWDYHAKIIEAQGLQTRFEVFRGKESLGELELRIPGRHNVLNALAAIVLSERLGVSFETIRKGFHLYRGVGRRFDVRWLESETNRAIVDDYGHHPTEIKATLATARSFWPGRILAVFQPHRYTRTLHCKDGFLSAFKDADHVLICDIYGAGEEPIAGVSAVDLVQSMKTVIRPDQIISAVGDLENAKAELLRRFQSGDLIVCLGAGTITRLPAMLIEGMNESTVRTASERV